MIFPKGTHPSITRPSAADGTPGPKLEHLISQEHLGKSGRLFAKVTLVPGAAVAPHTHVGDFEVYCIVSGEGSYSDNGEMKPVSAGDVTLCLDGEMHALSNSGTSDLIFIAFVGYDK